MKRTLIFIGLMAGYLSGIAQASKGDFQVGIGGLPIIYFDEAASNGYALRANVGYFPVARLSIGLLPFVGKVDNIQSMGAGVYLRYYFMNSRFSLFGEIATGVGHIQYDQTPQYDGTMSSFNVGPGAHFLVNKKLSIEILLQYSHLRNMSYEETTLPGNVFIPSIGIQYFILK